MEDWRDIPGWEGRYQVSDLGRVRSLPRQRSDGSILTRGRVLSLRGSVDRYLSASLAKDYKTYPAHVHRLVLLAFSGPCPPGHEACHYDGDGANNTLSNLRWGTPQDNAQDKVRHGRANGGCTRGELNGMSKLAPADVLAIRRSPLSDARVAESYGVSRACIYSVRKRRSWAWLKEED